ncbi:MAG: hypothetical protein FD148_3707, partial [Methylocystaceae bacterium]
MADPTEFTERLTKPKGPSLAGGGGGGAAIGAGSGVATATGASAAGLGRLATGFVGFFCFTTFARGAGFGAS